MKRSSVLSFFGLTTRKQARQERSRQKKRWASTIAAAKEESRGSGWAGIRSKGDDDAANREYATARGDVIQRSQDLDVNNADLGGWARTRVAQIVGSGVKFKHAPRPSEIDLTAEDTAVTARQVDRLRQLHSKLGGFDVSGKRYSEGKQQERAVLTAFINGDCLIHRVHRSDNKIVPFSIELIPGVRISTPLERSGDPLISYGIEYEDETRSRVVGYHVRRVSMTIGDNFIPNFKWDFLPIEDCSLLDITEQAGIDRSLPPSVRVARMARNRGEFMESTIECARAHTEHYVTIECAEGDNPWDVAADDAEEVGIFGHLIARLGNGVRALYTKHGEKAEWRNATLPDPDFTGFIDKTDERTARGLATSKSRFTRKVDNSWAGGRLEDQQDEPIILQYREAFTQAWQKVNDWFLEALWLMDAVELPGYSYDTAVYWSEFRATFPGKYQINPVDTATSREKFLMLRSLAPQDADEEDGRDSLDTLRKWAEWHQMREGVEKEYKRPVGSLDLLFSGKAISTSAGDEIAPPKPEAEPEPVKSPPMNGKKNGHRGPINRLLEQSNNG